MAEELYLVNPKTGSRRRLGGFKPRSHSSNAPKFSSSRKYAKKDLPSSVNLRPGMTPVEDQQQTQSCVGNAMAAAYEFLIKKKTGREIDVSRLFIYYNGRLKDGSNETNMIDEGCSITGAIEGLKEFGCCKEDVFPYDITKINKKPSSHCYSDGVQYRITDGLMLNRDLDEMKACLAENYPFAFGLVTFISFSEAETNGGRVLMPKSDETISQQHGRHAMLAVGYDDRFQWFIVKNSWGDDWGDKGYCYIPYKYMCNPELCDDIHTIKAVSDNVRRHVESEIPNTDKRNERRNRPNLNPLDDSDDFYTDQSFWNEEQLYPIYNANWQTEETYSHQWSEYASQQTTHAYFERKPRENNSGKCYILWIDTKSEGNCHVANQLTSDRHIQVDFSETFSMAQNHLRRHIDQIKSSLSTFQIICRGFYKSEDKNPLDLLLFLNTNHLKHIPVIVFTQDEQGLHNHLRSQAPSMNIHDWKDRLFITNDSHKLITRCKDNIANKLNNHLY